MYAQELLVHDRRKRQGAEGIHTRFIHPFGILVLTF